ncbi:hypothetical protein KHF85_10665 [Xanthomonas translucens pv. graminis]|uniref:hypothetical protein n=1 Tax=Xanthomonas graminis TaxID=3390026 RepID=UPI00253F87E9|nr:hypothetical protein [Xanthomonas translucens]WIH03402.1 hypothetical protein KHF85_10665 [Xanthomonas translucens pv. graminis]
MGIAVHEHKFALPDRARKAAASRADGQRPGRIVPDQIVGGIASRVADQRTVLPDRTTEDRPTPVPP